MTMKRYKFLTGFLALSLVFSLTACQKTEKPIVSTSDPDAGQTSQAPNSSASSEGASSSVPQNPDQGILSDEDGVYFGDETYGYVKVPTDWVNFQDLDGVPGVQFSNPIGSSIITLDIFDLSQLPQEMLSTVTSEELAKNVWYNLENSEVTNIVGASVQLMGLDAYQVYGDYVSEDYGWDSVIVCWIFKTEDGVFRYVAAEGGVDDIVNVVTYVESSYTLTKDA